MEFRILGPLEIRVQGALVPVGSARQRALLTALLLQSDKPVSVRQLIASTWGQDAPPSAVANLRSHVHMLRRRLKEAGENRPRLLAESGGYRLAVDPDELDLTAFEELLRQGRQAVHQGQHALAARRFGAALALWRGNPAENTVLYGGAEADVARLEEIRLTLVEQSCRARLDSGDSTVVGDLRALLVEHPLREPLWALLMLALHRAGRQGDALDAYERARAGIAAELGLDPGPHLRTLHQQVLTGDPSLAAPRASTEPAGIAPAGTAAWQPLAGRKAELAHLTERLDAALSGRPGVVLVEGEPGIGKTRLLEELDRTAAARGVPVLWGRGSGEAGAPAFWPWRQAVRALLADGRARDTLSSLGDTADELARIVPELAPAHRDARETAPPVGAEHRFALFELFAALLTRAATASRGLVVVLDDLHYADTASLLLLGHLARGLRDAPLLITIGVRPSELSPPRRDIPGLAGLAGRYPADRLALTGLPEAAVADQLRHVTGRPCDPAVAASVTRRTAGNPLFVQEIGKLLAAAGGAPVSEVPAAVRDAIREHLNVLSPRSRALLSTAAVLSDDIDARLLAAVARTSVDDVVSCLDEVLVAAVVRPARGGTGHRFAHDLVRECLCLDMDAGDRARIHVRAAEHLTALDDPAHLPRIARHRLAALPLGDPALAVRAAADSAELALRQLAYEDAVELFDRALAAGDLCGLDAHARGRLLIGKAGALHQAHDVSRAMRACETAAALARHTGDAEALGRAALVLADVTDAQWLSTVAPWCHEALARLPVRDSAPRAQLLALQAIIASVSEDLGLPDSSAAALAMAERLDDPAALTTALRARQLARSVPEGSAERLALGGRMLRLAPRLADQAVQWGHLWRFDALVQLGRVDEAEGELDLLEPVVARMRQRLARWHLVRSRAVIHFGRGHFARARAANDEAVALAEAGCHPSALWLSRYIRDLMAGLVDDGAERTPSPESRSRSHLSHMVTLGVAEHHALHGRDREARRCYARVPPLHALRPPPFARLYLYGLHGETAAAVGDREGCEAAYRRLLPYAAFHVATGAGVTLTRGSAQLPLGVAAAGSGRTRAAADHLRAAVASNRAAGLVPCTAVAQYRLAEQLLSGHHSDAHEEGVRAATEAGLAAARLGIPWLRARAAHLLGRAAPWQGQAP
ncbi:BTAD domain-containing putative transcriptional regulator [Streptomyces lasiicapitis]|uniref:BTAD domain-containing putative transcriptional regulator n=1 Tax=Streptomyces lasiicapitis TaxID=1923961 RepID=UPI0036BDD288